MVSLYGNLISPKLQTSIISSLSRQYSIIWCWDLDHEERSWKTFARCVYKTTYESTKLILERSSHYGWHIWKHNSHLIKTGIKTTPVCWPLFSRQKSIISDLILWKFPSHRKRKRPLSYIDAVSRDANIGYEDLPTAMSDRTFWRNFIVNTHLGWGRRK